MFTIFMLQCGRNLIQYTESLDGAQYVACEVPSNIWFQENLISNNKIWVFFQLWVMNH